MRFDSCGHKNRNVVESVRCRDRGEAFRENERRPYYDAQQKPGGNRSRSVVDDMGDAEDDCEQREGGAPSRPTMRRRLR